MAGLDLSSHDFSVHVFGARGPRKPLGHLKLLEFLLIPLLVRTLQDAAVSCG